MSPAILILHPIIQLHCRELLDELGHEIIAHAGEVLKDLPGTIDKVGLVVFHSPLLAEGLDELSVRSFVAEMPDWLLRRNCPKCMHRGYLLNDNVYDLPYLTL